MRTLVVYFSRTGTTRELARALALTLGAEVEEIVERTSRRGPAGYVRSLVAGATGRSTEVLPRVKDPRDYDLVVVGTPVWVSSMSSPVRAYLAGARERLPKVAFFCTMGGRGSESAFRDMERVAHRAPVASLAVREGARWVSTQHAIRDFAAKLSSSVAPARAAAASPLGASESAHAGAVAI